MVINITWKKKRWYWANPDWSHKILEYHSPDSLEPEIPLLIFKNPASGTSSQAWVKSFLNSTWSFLSQLLLLLAIQQNPLSFPHKITESKLILTLSPSSLNWGVMFPLLLITKDFAWTLKKKSQRFWKAIWYIWEGLALSSSCNVTLGIWMCPLGFSFNVY